MGRVLGIRLHQRRSGRGLLRAGWLWWCLFGCGAAAASVLNITTPGAWPEGRITWLYNPTGRPANIADDEVLAAANAAFAEWGRVCRVEARYGGLTTVAADPPPSAVLVVGWSDFGSPEFHARGNHGSTTTTGGYRPFTGGAIRINVANGELRNLFDRGGFVGVMQHEIGHVLGLSHSDEPGSIMFANPYNTAFHERMLQGDDIAACADLYGDRGLIVQPDLRDAAPLPGLAVKASVLAERPGSPLPTGSLARIDPLAGVPYYFDSHWQNLPPGSAVARQFVSPWGSVFQQSPVSVTTGASGFRFSTFPDDGYRFPFAGRWSLQVLVDGRLAASVPFEVTRGTAAPVRPFEAAVIGELDRNGALAWRVASHGNGAALVTRLVANGSATSGLLATPRPGANLVELWLETDRERYKIGQSDGQPARSLDVVRRVSFAARADGTPASPPLRVLETGTPSSYAAQAILALAEPGEFGVYVAAVVAGTLYFRDPQGWSDRAAPLVRLRAPAVALVDLLRNFDIRGLPAGTELYVGYGRSLNEVIGRGQYMRVRAF